MHETLNAAVNGQPRESGQCISTAFERQVWSECENREWDLITIRRTHVRQISDHRAFIALLMI